MDVFALIFRFFVKSCVKIVSVLIPEFFYILLNLLPEVRVMPTLPWTSPG